MTIKQDQHSVTLGATFPTRLELMGIRLAEGEPQGAGGAAPAAGQEAPAATEQQPGTAPAGQQAPAGAAPSTTEAPAAGINPRTNQPYTPEETQAHIAALNKGEQTQRERAEAAEAARLATEKQLADMLAVLGRKPDGSPADAPVDPAAVQAQLEQSNAAQAAQTRENAVLRVAPGLSANADRLLDSRSFMDELTKIDPTNRDAITQLVTTTVTRDSYYAATPPAAASSGPAAPHGGAAPAKAATLGDAVAAHYAKKQG